MWYTPPLEIYLQPVCLVFSNSSGLFQQGWVLASLQAFINVYKHYGSIAVDLDPRSKIQDFRKNFLDPRSGSKIQDYRKNFLDPRSGSKIQDPRLQKKLLGSKVWIQDPRFQKKLLGSEDKAFPDPRLGSAVDPRSFSWNLGSWIQTLDPRSFFCNLGSWIQTLDPRSFFCNLGSWILDPDLGSKKFFLESWILDLGSRPWIQELFL